MKSRTYFSIITCLLLSFSKLDAQYNFNFNYDANQKIIGLVPTPDDCFIILLAYDLNIDTSAHPFLLKTTKYFTPIWSKKLIDYPTNLSHKNSDIIQCIDGGIILTYADLTFHTGKITKFDSNGNFKWQFNHDRPSGASSYVGSIQNIKCLQKPNGKIIGSYSYFTTQLIYQLDSTGSVDWFKKIDVAASAGAGKEPGFDLLLLDDNSLFVTGKNGDDLYIFNMDTFGNIVWDNIFTIYSPGGTYNKAYCSIQTNDGNIITGGFRSLFGGVTTGATTIGFIMKINSIDGSIIWQKNITGLTPESITRIKEDRLLITGSTDFLGTICLAIFDEDGNIESSKSLDKVSSSSEPLKLTTLNNDIYLTALGKDQYYNQVLRLISIDSTLQTPCENTNHNVSLVSPPTSTYNYGFLNNIDFTSFHYSSISTIDQSLSIIPIDNCSSITDVASFEYETKFLLYPNPSSFNINLKFPDSQLRRIVILSIAGQECFNVISQQEELSIDIQNFPKGIFTLKIINELSNSIETARFIKQ